ncbi:BRO family protein [Pseudoalteromonas piscicida]|uniref:BRO-N domain-containing protein n=1 Tax=Pseudoalteromonas piscicida TaxID=43662 RepID=UPI0030C9DAE0
MQLQIFEGRNEEFGLDNLTTIEINTGIWFLAKEVCRALELKDVNGALGRLDSDEKIISPMPINGGQEIIISESGLYSLVFASRKPTAKEFQRWITKEVIPTIRKTGGYGHSQAPNFMVRFNANWSRVEQGYFSVISELFIRLYGRFEHEGYKIPDKALDGKEIRPDVSVGRLFSSYLKTNYPHIADEYKMYSHLFPDGSEFDARQYKNDLLPIFIQFVDTDWIPNRASGYFESRDPIALEYIPKLLPAM